MKALALALAAALLLPPGTALAQPGPPGQGPREFRGPPPGQEMQRRDEWRGQGWRHDAERRDEYRQREMERRQQWMSPEDRRDLRRDIRDHGRDVYGPKRDR
jgi:hypothetical protein